MGTCTAQLQCWMERLKEESDGVASHYEEYGNICELRLLRMEVILRDLRYEFLKEQKTGDDDA